jgi:hypothetical protein
MHRCDLYTIVYTIKFQKKSGETLDGFDLLNTFKKTACPEIE